MNSDFYFFDQYSRASHTGGVYRSKRDSKDFNQALYHVKVALAVKDDNHSFISTKKQTSDILLQTSSPIIPEILTKELDTILKTFDHKSKTNSPSPTQLKSPEEEFLNPITNLPKVSLPSSLIVQFHSTWLDLIQNTTYKYKVWRTKAGEEAWRQHLRRKRSQELNFEKQQTISDNKSIIHRRTSSRLTPSSITNSKKRLSRSFSRVSFLNSGNILPDNLRLLKSMHQGTSENVAESIKNGIHVEFKLSRQNDKKQQKFILIDVPKPDVNLYEDIIILTQNKCKRLLAETKQKILETTTNDQNKKHQKICQIWFYGDNQFIRNKNNTLNRRQKSKFVLAILRHEIPEKYNIDIDIPETKHKCYVELLDGSTQIYYPSGRLAVLRVQPPFFTTLFFDDTDSPTHQFLGLVTSTGNVILMQPAFHARFITDNQHEYAYLCNGKTGIIEKQFQYYLTNNCQRESIQIDEDNRIPLLFENPIQLQINSFMQLEYQNSSNILFVFKCQNEEFKFELGIYLPTQSSALINLTTTILAKKKFSKEKKFELLTKRSNSIISNNTSNILEKQQKFSDEETHSHQLSIMEQLILLRKRIEHICQSWLQQCRTTLGIMDIDHYCLSDLPPQPILTQTKKQIDDTNRESKSIKQFNEFVKSIDRQQQFNLTEKFESNVIANAIEQFVPHSDTGQAIKQRIYTKKILPVIK